MNGILPLWKPKGMTSHDCVIAIRKKFHLKKVGHTGTLDPEVEGVLPICIGQATKIVPYLTDTKKTYIAQVMLGVATETEDSHGAIIEKYKVVNPPSKQSIENVLQLFRGEITQIPPMYSAVKVNGKKLYEYARANEQVERPQRKVIIYQLNQVGETEHQDRFTIKATCSKGTYIRTLCVDIGKKLGYPAHMAHLVRTETGIIKKEDTVTFSAIDDAIELQNQEKLLMPISKGLNHLEHINVNENTKKRVLYGQKLPKPDNVSKTDPFVMMFDKQVLAIYQIHPEKTDLIKPIRVFKE
ncbi:tRNA pseudouridine synthase B [Virgibacillus subterraneus]|uniref:tRNA pseudouridine synthase B n=1 Tax=Virgibacillus subterraneus TaxID=621109 RepID=A0A1H9H3W2_9BACI|nr:tRNA pseudouridine(55) synthase TruB [Virgibacillus subterraneus]SEQ56918.1 tRNA pseudouridine synthase B [Virgibacillus subterraneus]